MCIMITRKRILMLAGIVVAILVGLFTGIFGLMV